VNEKKEISDAVQKLVTRLSTLPDEASRKRYVNRHRRVVHPVIVEQLAEAVRTRVRTDIEQAFALADTAMVIAEQLHDGEALARALRAKANALWFKGQCKPAVELLDRAAGLFQKAGKSSEVGRTLSTSIQPLALLGEYERAFSAAEKAREIFRRTGEESRLARLEINLANVLHRTEHFAEALANYEHAYKRLLPYKDAEGIGVALHNMAVCLIGLNDFHRALDTYENARKFCEQHGMPMLVAQADYNIAYLYYLRGDYTRALEILRRTRLSYRDNGDVYHFSLCNLDQSEIYLELNLIDEAAELAQEASAQFNELGLRYEAMRALTNLAIATSRKGHAFDALKLFTKARREATAENNPVWPRLIDLYKAVVLFDQRQFLKTHRLATTALRFFSSYPLPGKATICHLLLARVGFQTGDLDTAYVNCRQALEQLKTLEAPMLQYQAQLVMAQVQEAQGNLEAAGHSYQLARRALETLLSSIQAEELKIAFVRNRQEVQERLIQLCMTRVSDPASAQEAFVYMEEAKSRSLRDLILGRLRPFTAPAPEAGELDHRVYDLRQELNWYYHRIESEQLSCEKIRLDKIQRLQAEARACENELQRVLRELPASNAATESPRISAAITTEEMRAALHSDATIVEYFCVGERIVAAVLTVDELKIFSLGPSSRVRHRLRMLQFQLSRVRLHLERASRFQKSFVQAAQSHLHDLYKEVVAPLRHSLEGRHVIFAPHNVLHYLPFHALYDGKQYLMDSFTVSYAPTATIYALCHNRQANRSGPCLVLGVPDVKAPHILREVQSIAASVPHSELFLGSEASLDVLKRNGKESRMIHIATHGYFRQDNPLFSGIRLGDSYVSLYDLYQLQLPAQLLTLSGCATGLNTVASGDELLGLVRGLLYAGAQSLLLTLWDVADSSTTKLMESFYHRMQEQYGKARSLQAAMAEVREEYPHPYYWAPFVLIGKVYSS
jgi:CHAT domain-containing protein